ncbi:MAG: peptidylprolyl isomerase [Burkholderiales bacterium]|nr:peptidylprolyl isomerase [Burkholderiales bacterium]
MTKLFALKSTQALAGISALLSFCTPFEKKRCMGVTLALWTALAVPGLVQAQSNVQTRPADYIVAVVNSEPITNKEVQSLKLRLQKQLPPGTPSPSPQVLTQQALDQLINEKAQLQQARENGIRVDDNEVEQTALNIARQNQISIEDLYKRLALDGLSVSGFRDQVRSQLTISRLRERDVDSKARISDTEVEQQIQSEQAGQPSSARPIDLNLAMILIAVPENSSDKEVAELRLKAQQIVQRAKAGESFAALALSFSQAMDKGANGGEMGLRDAERYPSLFVESTQALRIGEVSEPVQSGAGFHILKVLDKKQSEMSSTMIVQTRSRHILLRIGNELTEAAARSRLLTYKQQIQAGTDFADLARQFSQDGSASAGGDLGWASPGQFVPEFEQVMARLRPGQVSDPLVSRFGVHLIQVLERREAPMTIREQREMVRAQLREKKLEELYANWVTELRGRAYVELREPPQ